MQRYRFPLAVLGTSLALVAVLVAVGAFFVGNALASGFPALGAWNGAGVQLPAELSGLKDIPADQRFGHFKGVQVNLTDKDNHPLTLTVTPGTITSVSSTSLTMAANDGGSRTFSLDSQTVVRGKPVQGNANVATAPLAQGDQVVVVTLNNSTTALAAVSPGANGFHRPGPFGH